MTPLDQPGRQVQRVLWSVYEAHRLRRSGRQPATGQAMRDRLDLVREPLRARDEPTGRACLRGGRGRPGRRQLSPVLGGRQGPRRRGARSVVVDLGQATVVEGPGLAALEAGRSAAQARHGELVLKSPRSATLALLERSGLSGTFPVS